MSERGRGAATDAAIAFTVRVLSAGLVFALQVLLARLMHQAEYGLTVALWTWLIAIGSFGALGFAEASVRFLPRYHTRGRSHAVQHYWRFGLSAVLAASTGLAAVAVLVAFAHGTRESPALVVLYVGLGLPFIAMEYYLEGVARSFGWFRLTTVPIYIVRPLLIGAACLALSLGGFELTFAVVGAVVVSSMAAVSAALTLLIAFRLPRDATAPPSPKPRMRTLWLRAALPLLLVSGLEDLFANADILILSVLMPPEDVGIYFAAVRVLALANFVHFALYFVSGRAFALALAERGGGRLQESVIETARLTFWSTLVALAATLAIGPLLLGAFGEGFRSGYGVMAILAGGILARAMAGQAGELLIVSGRQRQALVIAGGAFFTNAALCLALVPAYGLKGAAFATALSMAVRSAALIAVVRRGMGIHAMSLALPTLRVRAS